MHIYCLLFLSIWANQSRLFHYRDSNFAYKVWAVLHQTNNTIPLFRTGVKISKHLNNQMHILSSRYKPKLAPAPASYQKPTNLSGLFYAKITDMRQAHPILVLKVLQGLSSICIHLLCVGKNIKSPKLTFYIAF